ncbi:unnamed protein product [Caenorhabditis sp. 36 PRJEB53466]|nr:unnamed protein product [Caenorhabditis sp. 36 PRJEB53466]
MVARKKDERRQKEKKDEVRSIKRKHETEKVGVSKLGSYHEMMKRNRRENRLAQMMPLTEQAIVEILGRPVKGSPLYPETNNKLVKLTVLELADDLQIPVLDL